MRKFLISLLCLAMVFTMMPIATGVTFAGTGPTDPNYGELLKQPFAITALEDTTVELLRTTQDEFLKLKYSTDTSNWYDFPYQITVATGSSIYFKASGTNKRFSNNSSDHYIFSTGGKKVNVSGNIMSLLDGDNFASMTSLATNSSSPAGTNYSYCFYNLLNGQYINIVSATNLILPAMELSDCCYYGMFQNCTSLTEAPELPATTLTNSCYYGMFQNCTSLTKAPNLPATTLTNSCYHTMFENCTSLKEAPNLPAETLEEFCYCNMFSSCTSLKEAPELPVMTLAKCCYDGMFKGCTSLEEAPELPATTLTDFCYRRMFKDCTSLTKAPDKLPATKAEKECYYSMFENCKSLTEAPEISITELADANSTGDGFFGCLQEMFSGCTSLIKAPELKAATLTDYCYKNMFYGCTALRNAYKLHAMTMANSSCINMFSGCTSLIETPDMSSITTLAEACCMEMFKGCTSLTSASNLPATKAEKKCYYGMFSSCTSLVKAPEISITVLADWANSKGCLQEMFKDCKSLTKAPELKAATLTNYCYKSMFEGCTSLKKAPDLSAAKNINFSYCCSNMFSSCTSLNTIKVGFSTWPTSYKNRLENWVKGVPATGTFVCPAGLPHVSSTNYANSENTYFGIPQWWRVCDIAKYRDIENNVPSEDRATNNGYIDVPFGEEYDKPVSITIHPNSGYELDTLTVKDANGGIVSVTNNEFTMPDKAVEISATFKLIQKDPTPVPAGPGRPSSYFIEYYNQGIGNKVTKMEVKSGELIEEPTAPTAKGYEFAGWYKDENCTQAWDFDNDRVFGYTKLYAKWNIKDEGVKNLIGEFKIRANSKYVKHNGKYCTQAYTTILYGHNNLKMLKNSGYTVKYTFYRSDNKSKNFEKMYTSKTGKYINSKGVKGKMYYYRAVLKVYDQNGKLVTSTKLNQCKYGNRAYRGYKY